MPVCARCLGVWLGLFLAALRYLISGLDWHKMAHRRKPASAESPSPNQPSESPPPAKKRPWLRLDNEFLGA